MILTDTRALRLGC